MTFATVDEYFASFPDDVRDVLEEARRRIHRAIPGAQETISYDMAYFTRHGKSILGLAGWKRHISIYPAPAGDEAFEREIAPYRSAKSTVKFPLNKPVPYELIERIAGLLLAQRQGGTR